MSQLAAGPSWSAQYGASLNVSCGVLNWNRARNRCAKEDLPHPHPLIQDLQWRACYKLELPIAKPPLRTGALEKVRPTWSARF